MEKYWIIVDGKPQGPFTAEELTKRRDFRAELPVWTSRLTDWTRAGELPELACLLEEPTQQEVTDYVEATVEQEEPQQPQPQQPQLRWIEPREEINGERRPSSYLGWNVAMTLCCCMPAGIIGIVYSSMVNQKWQRGDVEGAKRASENAAWWLILSLVLGLVGWPFQMLFM